MGILSQIFGVGVKEAGEGVKDIMEGTGDLLQNIRSILTGELTAERRAELELKLIEVEAQVREAQSRINEKEAQHPSLFISGWRPACGWLGVAGLFYSTIGYVLLTWLSINFGLIAPPAIDTESLVTILVGMLGLSGMRSWEKSKGVHRNN